MGKFENEQVDLLPFDEREVNTLRGMSLVLPDPGGHSIHRLCRMIDWFESKLDEADEQDTFGTEGWRHHFGVED